MIFFQIRICFTALSLLLLFSNYLLWGKEESENKVLKNSPFSSLSQLRETLEKKRGTSNPAKNLELLNVSYDPTRALYEKLNPKFIKWWKERTGQQLFINQSHGGSAKQSRSISQGLQADVTTLAAAFDIDAIQEQANLLPKNWEKRLPHRSVPFTSTIVFLVRDNNPKNILDWDDLVKKGVSIVTPNPKTSGGAKWIYLAAWGYAMKKYNNDENKAKEFVSKLYKNAPTLDTGARGATTTFVQRDIGDVLITWENEAHLAVNEIGSDMFKIVIPSISIEAEPPVAQVDRIVDKRGTRDAAVYYLAFHYSKEGQEIGASEYFRPIDPEVAERYSKYFPRVEMLNVNKDFGGWKEANEKHFKNGGTFDQIYNKSP